MSEADKSRSQLLSIPHLKLIARIGEGGMSTVWKAWDTFRQQLVAVKILNRELSSNPKDIAAFHDEARLLQEIRHPGIVTAFDFNIGNGNWYYEMEYIDGYTFADYLRSRRHVRESDCLLICESVAVALAYAWNDHGVVHCDLKPENIMINTAGEIKLMDLGISHRFRQLEPKDISRPEQILGTPAYISPEQIYADVEPDCRADIYSLAATIYHLATGRTLFPGLDTVDLMRAHCDESKQARDPRLIHAEFSESFCRLLESMLVKNRDKRLSNWNSVLEMCQQIEHGVLFKPRASSAVSSLKLID